MNRLVYFSFLLISLTSSAIANEAAAHHEVSFLDLKYPLINFILMMAILSKVVKPLREQFNKQADDVKSLMESAAKNSKDAEEKLKTFSGKIKNIDSELVKISADYESDAVTFSNHHANETQTTIARIKRDIENKLSGEKKEMIDELNHDLLNAVISKAKGTIKSSKDLGAKATSKIVAELR